MLKKKITLFAASLLALGSVTFLAGCAEKYDVSLTVYNWEDYIYEGAEDGKKVDDSMIEKFQKYYAETHDGLKLKVFYKKFSTNEELYTQISQKSLKADLICPSDYMIQKMANEGRLLPFSYNETTDKYTKALENWDTNSSPFIRDRFKNEKLNDGSCFLKYAVPYFWGTMGFVYDADYFEEEEVSSWEVLWSSEKKYQNQFTLKDSVRDTYLTGIFHVYKDEIAALDKTAADYNSKLSAIFNKCDDETVTKVGAAIKEARTKTVRGFEVDTGKNEIVESKTFHGNLAWSGDAVYAMDCGDDANRNLHYVLPEEGSNVWFDGWCMPKGANQELAEEFVNFICRPDNAALNMDAVGYTSPIVGAEMWEYVNDTYAADEDETDTYDVDLSFYFGEVEGGAVISIPTEDKGRQFDAQYPTEEQLKRCCIMKDFGAQQIKVDTMWQDIK